MIAWLRSLLVMIFVFPWWTALLCGYALLKIVWYQDHHRIDPLISFWARTSRQMFGVDFSITDRENIPNGGCLFLFNHRSFMDIFILCEFIPEVRFGAKLELFSIPIFGRTITALGTLPIARQDPQRAIRVLQQAYDRARSGEKFALSPEGGRSQSPLLGAFKSGPFHFAIQSGVPVVPVIIAGAAQAWEKGALLPNKRALKTRVTARILPPITTESLSLADRHVLAEQVFCQMREALVSSVATHEVHNRQSVTSP